MAKRDKHQAQTPRFVEPVRARPGRVGKRFYRDELYRLQIELRRFEARIQDPTKRWKLSAMDLESRRQWLEYSKAKDVMFAHTDIKQAPWYVVEADNKRLARLNCMRHLLTLVPYDEVTSDPIELPPRQEGAGYIRPPMSDQTFIPDYYPTERVKSK